MVTAVAISESAHVNVQCDFGDTIGVGRLASGVRRSPHDDLTWDPRSGNVPRQDSPLEVISDAPYDPTMWADADDAGRGAYRNHGEPR